MEDGDTVVLEDDTHVRYIGMNAPEIEHQDRRAEPFGGKAKAFLQKNKYSKQDRLFEKMGCLLGRVRTGKEVCRAVVGC